METTMAQHDSAHSTATTTPASTDEALLAAMARGEAAALETLYARYGRAVFTVALAVVQDHAEAEEVTQEAFLRAWLRARSYNPDRGRVAPWLRRLTRHLAIDQTRRRRLVSVGLELTEDAAWLTDRSEAVSEAVEHAVWLAERRRKLLAALRALPAKYRDVIAHAYFGELTHAEIAARLSLPLGTVKSRTWLGLRRLRALVGGQEEETAPLVESVRRWEVSGDHDCLPAAS